MNAIKPVIFTTSDGVDRELRFTLGARKLIADQFGPDLQAALNEHGDGIIPNLLYACMHDAKGNPPADLTLTELAFGLPGDGTEAMAAFLAAASQGGAEKNEVEALLRKTMEEMNLTGLNSTPSERSASDSASPSSGGESLPQSSTPESDDTTNSATSGTSEPAP